VAKFVASATSVKDRELPGKTQNAQQHWLSLFVLQHLSVQTVIKCKIKSPLTPSILTRSITDSSIGVTRGNLIREMVPIITPQTNDPYKNKAKT
jgi:hypothetical protein